MPTFAPLQPTSNQPISTGRSSKAVPLFKQKRPIAFRPLQYFWGEANQHNAPLPFLQTKLEVSHPGDALEQEADRVADKVMRMPVSEAAPDRPNHDPLSFHLNSSVVQRACSSCNGLQSDEENRVQRATSGAGNLSGRQVTADWSQRLRLARSTSGEPLSQSVHHFMEPRFGTGFRQVRIHHDETASALAEAIGARAFTVHNNVFFKRGEYQPTSERGQRLIAHELAHVVQQSGLEHGEPPKRSALAETSNEDALILRQSNQAGASNPARLQSSRFASSAKLERCFEDKDRLRPGDPDADAVVRVQQALVDLQQMTGHTYDLGTSGPNHNGVDGKYGSKTAAAVMQFKADEKLGSTQFGDVGPGVMHRLDELFRAAPTPPSPTPPTPTPPTPTPPQICGPDVTQETAAAVAHTQSAFGGWNHDKQEEACDELDRIMPHLGGGLVIPARVAWDIIELHNQGWLDAYSSNGCATPAQPHPCARTVTIMRGGQAQCWYPGSVNYVIFGTMCRLCMDAGYLRWTENYMQWLIRKYKSSSANLQESIDWATAGYGHWSASSGPARADRQQCSPTCGLPLTIAFHVAWRPHSTHQSPTI